ncbi:MAG: hypothetical protein Q7R53_01085 [bacterium]|nr:hypothetical protein [bacterium]
MSKQSTQSFLEFDQIREGIVILNDKGLRGILMTSSQNFALKSEDEQNATLYQFQNFLNSLDFSCQIVVQSRRLNITGYLDRLRGLEKKQENELLKIQTAGYREFIESIVASGSIMTKVFFIVVPFSLMEAISMDPAKRKSFKAPALPSLTEEMFQRCKTQLWQRMEFVALGLKRCGLQAVPLSSPEIIELFWSLHHPSEAEVGYYPEIPPEIIQ